MSKRILSIICVLSLFFIFNYPVYGISGGGEGTRRDGDISPSNWYSLSDEEKYYTARRGAINNGLTWNITLDQYKSNQQAREFINNYGYYYTMDLNDPIVNGAYNYHNGTPWGQGTSPAEDAVYIGIIDDGSENVGSWSDYVGNSVADAKRDEFYSSVSHSNPTSYNCGNGYSFKVEMICDNSTSPTSFVTYQATYFNGNEISSEEKHRTSGFRGTDNVYQYDFWITKSDNTPYVYNMNFTYYYLDMLGAQRSTTGGYQLDATMFDYVPSGMNQDDIIPSIIGGSGSAVNPYLPVDGSNQSGVNEEIQKQNNDIINWLEKIYNAELAIDSSIKSLFSPISSLYGTLNNLYNVSVAILNKLDNLTVKLKDWSGNEFKIELGDLELGDLNIDFDVVYNITGIQKITSPSDLTNKLPTYKSTLESKVGITNMKTSINNFTQALFGQSIFGQNGSVVSGTISENTSTPHWYFTFQGNTYDLFSYLSMFDSSYVQIWKDIVSFFLLLGTGLTVFKYIPTLVGNVSGAYNTVNSDTSPSQLSDAQYRTYLNHKFG